MFRSAFQKLQHEIAVKQIYGVNMKRIRKRNNNKKKRSEGEEVAVADPAPPIGSSAARSGAGGADGEPPLSDY